MVCNLRPCSCQNLAGLPATKQKEYGETSYLVKVCAGRATARDSKRYMYTVSKAKTYHLGYS